MPAITPAAPAGADAEIDFLNAYVDYIRKIVVNNSKDFQSELLVLGMDMDDLVQEAVLGALAARRSYDPQHGTTLRSWVINGVRNVVAERRMRCWEQHQQRLRVAVGLREVRRPVGLDEADRYVDLLERTAAKLPALERQVMIERTSNLAWLAISKKMRVPEKRIRKARVSIRAAMEMILAGD